MFRRIMMGFGIFLGVIILCMAVLFAMMSSVNAPKSSHEETLQSAQESPRKALIVYQPSLSSFTGDIAHQIAKGLNGNGFAVTLNNPGDYLPTDLSQYDVVVFGSPVYAGKVSKALTDYMAKITALPSGKIVLFSTGGVPDDQQELTAAEQSLNGATIYKKVKFNAKDNNGSAAQAYSLGAEMAK